jgi:type 1 glutamine amidotransferase
MTSPTVRPAPGSREVLVFTRTTGYRHASIEKAAETVQQALTAAGWKVEVSADPKVFAPATMGRFAGIVLVSTTGKPLGEPAQAELAGLDAWVHAGGALIGLHAASSTLYESAQPYIRLVGGKFINHPGSVRPANCHPEGTHPAVARLPSPFPVRDEIYRFEQLNPANVVILRCDEFNGTAKLPIAWHRQEGAGRVFYSALGHAAEDFAPDAPKWRDHLLPGIIWALAR